MKLKNIILTSFALLATNVAFAQQKSVMLHHDGEAKAFSNFTDPYIQAYNEAVDGDTIYLPGGFFNQPGEYRKTLHIYGAGACADSAKVTGPTILNGNFQLRTGCDNFSVEGLQIIGNFYYSSDRDTLENISMKYIYVQGAINYNWYSNSYVNRFTVTNCVVTGGVNLGMVHNVLLQNNVFQNTIDKSNQNLIKNNLFLYSNSRYCVVNGDNNMIINNAILNVGGVASGNMNICKNNIYDKSGNVYGSYPILENNYENLHIDTLMVNQSGNVYSIERDYHFVNPEAYIGTDGTQVGIYGGKHPWKEGQIPSNPYIRKNDSAEETDDDGQLQLNINVVSQ